MSAADLLEQARAAGILLALGDGRLTWEADQEPPIELLEKIRAHRQEIIESLSVVGDPQPQAMEWLRKLAVQLCCTPEYLLEHGYVDCHDLIEQYQQPPWLVASLIRAGSRWKPPSEEAACLTKGALSAGADDACHPHARMGEGYSANAHASFAWRAARDAYHAHALGACPRCYPPLKRHCAKGAELRARYDYETDVLETRDEKSEA